MKILNQVEREKKEQKRTKNNFFDLKYFVYCNYQYYINLSIFLSIHNSNNFFLNILKYYNLII